LGVIFDSTLNFKAHRHSSLIQPCPTSLTPS
jgi:hypothetical protein